MSLPPDDKDAKKHWIQQEPRLGRKFREVDRGLTQVASADDIQAIVQTEVQGQRQPVYRQKTSHDLEDPVARSTNLIRQYTEKGIPADAFMKQCETVEDMTLFLALYGDMGADKKAQTFLKLSKLLWDKQKEVLKQNNIERAREDREVRNQVELAEKLRRHSKRSQVIDAQVVTDKKPDGAA